MGTWTKSKARFLIVASIIIVAALVWLVVPENKSPEAIAEELYLDQCTWGGEAVSTYYRVKHRMKPNEQAVVESLFVFHVVVLQTCRISLDVMENTPSESSEHLRALIVSTKLLEAGLAPLIRITFILDPYTRAEEKDNGEKPTKKKPSGYARRVFISFSVIIPRPFPCNSSC